MFLKYCSASTTPSAGEGGAWVPPCGAACPVTFAMPATLNASPAHTVIATPIAPRFTLNSSILLTANQMLPGTAWLQRRNVRHDEDVIKLARDWSTKPA